MSQDIEARLRPTLDHNERVVGKTLAAVNELIGLGWIVKATRSGMMQAHQHGQAVSIADIDELAGIIRNEDKMYKRSSARCWVLRRIVTSWPTASKPGRPSCVRRKSSGVNSMATSPISKLTARRTKRIRGRETGSELFWTRSLRSIAPLLWCSIATNH